VVVEVVVGGEKAEEKIVVGETEIV
jgi:hypothetical protein